MKFLPLSLLLPLSLGGCLESSPPRVAPPLPLVSSQRPPSPLGDRVIRVAQSWLGTPYRRGSENKGPDGGVDCSHLVHSVYREAGLDYPYVDSHAFPPPGYFVKLPDNAQGEEGDVVLFAGHMGILLSKELVISAQGSPSKPGKVQVGSDDWFGKKLGVFRWAPLAMRNTSGF